MSTQKNQSGFSKVRGIFLENLGTIFDTEAYERRVAKWTVDQLESSKVALEGLLKANEDDVNVSLCKVQLITVKAELDRRNP